MDLVMLVAQEASGVPDPWGWVLDAGAIGALLLFLYGFHAEWWVTGKAHQRALKRLSEVEQAVDRLRTEHREAVDAHAERVDALRDAKDAEVNALRDRIDTQVIPMMTRATDLLGSFVNRTEG